MIQASQDFLKVCSRANRKLVCPLLKTVAKPTANQKAIRDFCVEFQFRIKTALHKRAWNFFLTMEPAAPWLGQVKKQKAGYTSRQCTNLWVLHVEDSEPPVPPTEPALYLWAQVELTHYP